MVMDELVDELNPVLGYRLPNDSSVSTMAFADDLLLVSESLTGIKSLLSTTETFLQSHGLVINARKSYLIGLKKVGSRKQLRAMMEPFLQVGHSDLPVIGPQGSVRYRYLGVFFEVGGSSKVMKQEFPSVTAHLAGSALKPQQRMELLRSFILPRWRFRLVLGRVTIATMSWLNREVQRVVRQTLHTPSNFSKEWIHLEMKKGGLGIPDALTMTYLGKARLADWLSNTEDGKV